MRLLDVESWTLKEFTDETRVSYAILSHRWEDDEVLFQDITQGMVPFKKGWEKVENFCRIAKKEGFRYGWIDTCCIDKSSSTELSEAINSMYRWYQHADTCFAYLNDCSYETFTRGWTLQELIAPAEVVFLSAEWREFGTKRSLAKEISDIKNIDETLLQFPEWLDRFCAAQKLSWAATREMIRVEDRAYSLMGLFNVNMPLLYGEGDKAFFRLQMEILQSSNDQSIFAWKHNPEKGLQVYSSILATSLGNFEGCHKIRHAPRNTEIADGSGMPDFAQQGVGSLIKLKVLSIPYDSLFTPGSEEHEQCPPWLTSAHQEIFTQGIPRMSNLWLVFLADCSEEDRTIGIALQLSDGGYSRYHRPSRFLLPKGLDSRSHSDLKKRTFYVRSLINDPSIMEEPITLHLRHIPAKYGVWGPTPVLLPSGLCDSVLYWRNNGPHRDRLGRTTRPWIEAIGPGGEGVYFLLGFSPTCDTDSLPTFHLEFWNTYGDDGLELLVLFRKDAQSQNPIASPKPSSPNLLLGPQEFKLTRDVVVVVKARNGTDNKILLSISVENEWTGDKPGPSTLAVQRKREADAWL
ncbi:hypothetical protein LCI18_004954 [Fusarium solani-melongenae]|uniref:Uncharacterized protein n=1 Tax=Fusarium solani subsp. cucurbitae TaxID=2747967 RepID=A0ACD3YYI2_FUSSC|nr:hypothetical protein LCI18_004954 [Fusarium solani-melongenae]